MRILERPILTHIACMDIFRDIFDETGERLCWLHVSKARLLPLGDVCGIIARILDRLVMHSDVYWVMAQ